MRIGMKTKWISFELLALLIGLSGSQAFAEADAFSTQPPVKKIVLEEVTVEVTHAPFRGESVTVQVASQLEDEATALLKKAIDEGEKILDQIEKWNQLIKLSTIQTMNQKNRASIQLTDAIEEFFDRLDTLRHVDSNAWLRLFQQYTNSSASKALSALDKNFSPFRVSPAAN